MVKENTEQKHEIDIFRDTSVRYLGYANEIGEAFRGLIPISFVWTSYIIASGYVVADTVHKGLETYKKDNSPNKIKQVILSTSDALLWQSFASVIIPGLTINKLCSAVRYVQGSSLVNSPALRSRKIPTIIGLLSIPLIIHPIDNLVENIMNATYRQWTGFKPQKQLKSN